MFSSKKRLAQKTPAQGIDRKEFINLLVDEYYETTNVEAQEQVTANLANFSYDPLNWEYLKESKAVELFLQLLNSANQILVSHGVAALCNICLDHIVQRIIIDDNGIEAISSLLIHNSCEVVENSIATLLQLHTTETHSNIFSVQNRCKVATYQKSSNIPLQNLAIIFLETARDVTLETNDTQPST